MMKPYFRSLLLTATLAVLAGCATPDVTSSFHDPLEPTNRAIHGANKVLDRAVLRPASTGYGTIVPPAARRGASNFAENLSIPGTVVNDLLQFQVGDALHNTARFALNTVAGLGGLFDAGEAAGLEPRPTDFGETLHVWGFGEGAYLELPVLGPSTTRDTAGLVIDYLIDPMGGIIPDAQAWVRPTAFVVDRMNDRYVLRSTVDGVLYESEDSYAQTRLFYLENRRYNLGQSQEAEEDLYDLYDEAFE